MRVFVCVGINTRRCRIETKVLRLRSCITFRGFGDLQRNTWGRLIVTWERVTGFWLGFLTVYKNFVEFVHKEVNNFLVLCCLIGCYEYSSNVKYFLLKSSILYVFLPIFMCAGNDGSTYGMEF